MLGSNKRGREYLFVRLDCAVVAGHASITFSRFILPARVGLVGSLRDVALETPRCLETV